MAHDGLHQLRALYEQRGISRFAAIGILTMRGHFPQIVPGGKGSAFGGEDDCVDGGIAARIVQRGLERGHQPFAQRIAGGGAVQRQAQDGAGAAGEDERGLGRGLGLVGHEKVIVCPPVS